MMHEPPAGWGSRGWVLETGHGLWVSLGKVEGARCCAAVGGGGNVCGGIGQRQLTCGDVGRG